MKLTLFALLFTSILFCGCTHQKSQQEVAFYNQAKTECMSKGSFSEEYCNCLAEAMLSHVDFSRTGQPMLNLSDSEAVAMAMKCR